MLVRDDIIFITTLQINGLSVRWIYFFEIFLNISLINSICFFVYCFLASLFWNISIFVCPPVRYIHSSSVLLSWYLKHACPWWFRFSLILNRHYFITKLDINDLSVDSISFFDIFLYFFNHQGIFFLQIGNLRIYIPQNFFRCLLCLLVTHVFSLLGI